MTINFRKSWPTMLGTVVGAAVTAFVALVTTFLLALSACGFDEGPEPGSTRDHMCNLLFAGGNHGSLTWLVTIGLPVAAVIIGGMHAVKLGRPAILGWTFLGALGAALVPFAAAVVIAS